MNVFTFLSRFFEKKMLTLWSLCFFWSFKESFFPFLVKLWVDGSATPTTLYTMWFAILAVWAGMEIAMRIQGRLSVVFYPELRRKVLLYCLENLYDSHECELSETITKGGFSRVTSIPDSVERIFEWIVLHFTSIGTAVILDIVLLATVSPIFSSITLIWILIHIGIVLYFEGSCRQAYTDSKQAHSNLCGVIQDSLYHFFTVSLFSAKKTELSRFEHSQEEEMTRAVRAHYQSERVKICLSICSFLYLLAMTGSVLFLHRAERLSSGDFVFIPIVTFSLLGMLWWVGYQVTHFLRELGELQANLSLLRAEHPEKSLPIQISSGEIVYDQVNFSYYPSQPLIKNFSLHISSNECVALCGVSGVGKTTLMKLLLGIVTPTSGNILIDGHRPSPQLYPHIALAPQEPHVLNRSLRDNLLIANPKVTDTDIENCLNLVCLGDWYQALPAGIETLLGDRGKTMSAGQKQRLGIARALIKNSPIIILDEPTSYLDPDTESKLIENLREFIGKHTFLIITHRPQPTELASRIIQMSGELSTCFTL